MAREWQKVAAIRRKRISLPRTHQDLDAGYCSTSSVADKGHFVVYTADQRRFMIPLVYLNSKIFRELFEMSEEEFGLPSDGPITLPCDSFFMEYIIFLVQRGVAKDLEKALLTSIAYTQSSSSFFSHQEQMNSRLLVCRSGRRLAAIGRKRITLQRTNRDVDADCCSTSSMTDKRHFVVYSSDRRRFLIPLGHLNTEIFKELLQMSEEEFGVQSDGPIILPCDSVFMDCIILFIQCGVVKDLERALVMSIASSNCLSSRFLHEQKYNKQPLLCAF
ncbi:hypothetical protein PVL29_002912 [Vitis rotundifolia]|uniref:Uncharacterized protein n=1 Tax=Vitis rotundifolia TaxID=103349 RepID=A0AA39ADZ8_VITRO|nr:hypothetical protein PVL29_002912 [Vitis rotundifolia]